MNLPSSKLTVLVLAVALALFISFSTSASAETAALISDSTQSGAKGAQSSNPKLVAVGNVGVSIVNVASGRAYAVVNDGLNSGAQVYIDRVYSFTSVPGLLEGSTYIQTANNDKRNSQQDFLTLQVDQDVTAYVAYDNRATSLPNWLAGWTDTGMILGTTDVARTVFSKDFSAGTISLGGNFASGASGVNSNYNVVLLGSGVTSPPNQGPLVNAGQDQSVVMNSPVSALMDAAVSDDGLPSGQLDLLWSQVSGPGAAIIADPSRVDTTVTFPAEGVYVLRLTVDDGDIVASDDITVTVNSAPSTPLEVTITSVASGKTYQVIDQRLVAGEAVYIDRSYTYTSVPELIEGSTYVQTANNDKAYTDSNFLTLSVNQDVRIYVGYDFRATSLPNWLSDWALQPQPIDTSDVTRNVYLKEFPAGTVTLGGNLAPGAAGVFSNYTVFIVGMGSGTPSNTPPSVNAGPDTSGTLQSPAVVALGGAVSDDGLPLGQLELLWSVVSGPGSVVFGDASAEDTTATFVEPGLYVLRLTATDGDLSSADELNVTINAPNIAPLVDAGPDAAIVLTDAAVLGGVVTDDGLPNPPGAVTFQWSQVGGAGVASFADASAASTTATFSTVGDYILRLTADDGDLSSSDDTSIVVSAANQAPQISAGPDATIKVSDALALDGDVIDDGLPDPPGVVSAMWTKVSGLGSVSFGNATSVDTIASFSEPGTYELRLTGSDGDLTVTDQVMVTVEPDTPPAALEVTNLSVASGASYEVVDNGLNSGAELYTDRAYTTTTVPGIVDGYTYIKTANDDKTGTGNNFLSFSINQDAVVYVAYDSRATSLPAWLLGWSNTGATLGTTDVGLDLFARDFPAGSVTLGGNSATGASGVGSNYIVVISGSGVTAPPPVPGNQSPFVNAGSDATVTLGTAVVLNGTVSDDGNPNPPGALTIQWSMVSGPGPVTFASPAAPDTTASFSAQGAYVLRLTANDGDVSASDDVAVTVVTSNPSNTISVNPNIRHQTIVGWEVTDGIGIWDYPNDYHRWRDEVIDRAVNEAGINRVRLETHQEKDRVEGTNDNSDPFSINWNGFDFTSFDERVENVVIPMRQKMQANGEELWVNFNPVSVASSDTLPTPDHFHKQPEEYAEFVLAHFLHLQSKYGFIPDSVEMSLEPDVFNTFDRDGSKLGEALVATANMLNANGFTNVDIYGPSNSNMSSALSYFDSMVQVPGVLDHLDVFTYHRYGSSSTAKLNQIADRAGTYGLGTAMLEHINADYNELHEDLKVANNVAWQQYTLAATVDRNLYHVTNINTGVVKMGVHTKYLRQYFKFVRKGAVRVEADSSDSKFDPLAFINSNGKYVVVVKASGGGNFSIGGLPAGTYGIKHTTPSQYDVDHADVTIGQGQSLTTNMPDDGVITIYGK